MRLLTCMLKSKEQFVMPAKWRQQWTSQYHPLLAHFGGAKTFACCQAAFQKGSLMNALKCQIGVALILKCFWWIFIPEEAKFHFNTNIRMLFLHFDQNQLKQRKISSNLFVVVLTSSTIKVPGMSFGILILAVINYRSPPNKLIQETNTIFGGTLTTQTTSK